MAKFSLLELTALAVALDEETAERRRRWAVHPAWSKRESEGEFVTLYKELIDDEMSFIDISEHIQLISRRPF